MKEKDQGSGVRGREESGKRRSGESERGSFPASPLPRFPVSFFHKGISIDGWRVQRVTPEALGELKALGVNAISYLPFGYQDEDDRPALREGEFEQYGAVLAACADAHRAGMGVAIKPHLWVRERDTWHGRIAMKTEADWRAWFEGYRRLLLKFAAVAEAGGADLFCIGTELSGTSGREADWRALIREVRAIYRGPITYAANWDGEAEQVAFWDALDFIGIDAYYPLSKRASPSVDDLVAAWGPILGRIEGLNRKYGRPVLFMEVGYPATEGAAQAPYREERGGALDLMGQATCYEALFRACLGRPWMAGMYLWRWNDPDRRSGPWDPSYNLRDKPAVAVIRKWYGTDSGKSY